MAIEPERHTFLFEPGVWNGTGTSVARRRRAAGHPLAHRVRAPQRLLAAVRDPEGALGPPPTEFQQAYLIELPRAPGDSLKWTFDSAMFGKLQGRFVVVGSSILAGLRL